MRPTFWHWLIKRKAKILRGRSLGTGSDMFLILCRDSLSPRLRRWEYRRNPQVEGLVLLKHGLFTFGETARQSYERTIDLNNLARVRAEEPKNSVFIPRSRPKKEIGRTADIAPCSPRMFGKRRANWQSDALDSGTFRCSDQILEFVNGRHVMDYANRGTVTPDHLIRTKGAPLFLSFPEADALLEFRRETATAISDYIALSDYFI